MKSKVYLLHKTMEQFYGKDYIEILDFLSTMVESFDV